MGLRQDAAHAPPTAMQGRRIELDFLRGIAILAVMGTHFHTVQTGSALVSAIEYPLKSYSHQGVSLFFTLSGFLVGGLLFKQYAQAGQIDAWRFIVRRIFKIWPAYYALILFHVLAGHHPTSTFLVQNLTHMQNYWESSITQTWSLAVEEHFYLLLPLLLSLFVALRLRANTIVFSLLAVCGAVLALRCIAVSHGELDEAYHYTQYRIDGLLFGVILAAIYWLKPALYRRLAASKKALGLIVLGVLAWIALTSANKPLDESIGFTIQALGFCAMIVLALEHARGVRDMWLFRAVAWVGVYSYAMYLWHTLMKTPADVMAARFAAAHVPVLVTWIAVTLTQFAGAFVLGYVMTRVIEFPFLRLRDALFSGERRTAPAGGQPISKTAVDL